MSSDLMSGMMSGASTGAMYSPDPVTGAIIGATIGGVSGAMSGKRKKKAQRMRDQGMQRAIDRLKVDAGAERDLDRSATKGGMDWYKSNVLDTEEGKAAYATMKDDKTMQDILKRRKAQADEGMGAKNIQAQRNLDQSSMGQAIAQMGLSTGAALGSRSGAAVGNILASTRLKSLEGLAQREQEMFLANEQAKERGLDDYQETYTAQRMFDIRQAKDKLGSMFTYGTSEAQRESNTRNLNRQLESKMIFEKALAEAEETASGGFLGMF